MNPQTLIFELKRDEGFKSSVYQDSLGYWTIGIGRLVDDRRGGGITEAEAMYLLGNDVQKIYAQLTNALPWFQTLSDARQRALCNMTFQMGIGAVLQFKNTLSLMQSGQFSEAADNAQQSKWYLQTPGRAERVLALIREG